MIPVVVSTAWLAEHPDAVVADVRWYLDGRDARAAYRAGHLPGAVFVDLPTVLAGPGSPEVGRHPLPEPDVFAAGMRAAGIADASTVVAYDDAGGAQAGRLVWLLRALGVDAAVLDGGIGAWAGELQTGDPEPPASGDFPARPWPADAFASIDEAASGDLVLDARAAERYRGDVELIDAVAGHIPGARSAPFPENLAPDGRFRSPSELADRFAALGVTDAAGVISYCGSGVTGCHNLVALEHAGLGRGRLYVGSWSQYAASGRPVATGDLPGERPAGA